MAPWEKYWNFMELWLTCDFHWHPLSFKTCFGVNPQFTPGRSLSSSAGEPAGVQGMSDVPNSHWLVDEKRGVSEETPEKQQVSMLIDGINQLPAKPIFTKRTSHWLASARSAARGQEVSERFALRALADWHVPFKGWLGWSWLVSDFGVTYFLTNPCKMWGPSGYTRKLSMSMTDLNPYWEYNAWTESGEWILFLIASLEQRRLKSNMVPTWSCLFILVHKEL